jgi:hypothetical protein
MYKNYEAVVEKDLNSLQIKNENLMKDIEIL